MGRHRGARGRMIRCGEVSRNGQVSGNGGMGRSSWVIGVTSGSNRASRQMSGHNEQTQRCREEWTDAEGQTVAEGQNLLSVMFSWFLL